MHLNVYFKYIHAYACGYKLVTNKRQSTKLQIHKQVQSSKITTHKYQVLSFNTTNIHNVSHKQLKINNIS